MNSNHGIIFEITSIAKPADITVIKESYNKENDTRKLVFKTVLQTIEEVNQNRRFYPRKVGNEIVSSLKPKARDRSLLQEIDHPTAIGDESAQKRRAATIEVQNCGSLIRDIYIDGNNIIGEVETLTGFKGPDLYNLIKYDKANIGFSVRMFGKFKKHPTIREVNEVALPIRTVTYDVVSSPSHKTAKIIEFIPESASEFQEDLAITESSNLFLTTENIHLPESSKDIVDDYLLMVLNESFDNLKSVRFKI